MFLFDQIYAVIRGAEGGFPEHGHNISMCDAYFEGGERYLVEFCSDYYIDGGAIGYHHSITIRNGSVDGYDTPSGIRYNSLDDLNKDFTFLAAP